MSSPKARALLQPKGRSEWRKWLKSNHARLGEIWLVYCKVGHPERTLGYAEAVEEALCFGWIDSTTRPMDEGRYMQLFTPRRNLQNWSAVNLERFARMESEGKMTAAGRAKKPHDVAPPAPRLGIDAPVPDLLERALSGSSRARTFFDTLAPGYRRDYIRFVVEPKLDETRRRRASQAIEKLESGVKRVNDTAAMREASPRRKK